MRNRMALIITIYAAGIAAAILTITTPGASAPQTKEASWTSAPSSAPRTLWPQRTELLSPQALMPLATYATAVEDDQAAHAFAAAEAAVRASESSSTASRASTSPPSTTTAAPAPSTVYSCDPVGGDAAARAVAAGVPCAWVATAVCEEQGYDGWGGPDGFFGIQEWNGFDGYPNATAAPLSVQLAWEAAHGQGPPDAPGDCHSY